VYFFKEPFATHKIRWGQKFFDVEKEAEWKSIGFSPMHYVKPESAKFSYDWSASVSLAGVGSTTIGLIASIHFPFTDRQMLSFYSYVNNSCCSICQTSTEVGADGASGFRYLIENWQ
jgi:hypothetical protein